jgi:CheY-like chemotaxis protein
MARAKIMVIEDNPSEIFLLRRALMAVHGENFDLEIAADGERALHYIRGRDGHKELHPCVILVDLHLPKHDGLEILRAIRQNPVLTRTQVVVTTNAATPKEVQELQRLGINYRLKPGSLAEFTRLAADLVALCGDGQAF